ncbi:MAG: hypothetical protein ACXABD_20765 [Candidatus Thorarchaeota archaeon]|jgi:hypothetical protein
MGKAGSVTHECNFAIIENYLGSLVIFACPLCPHVKHFQYDGEFSLVHFKTVEEGSENVGHSGSTMQGLNVSSISAYQVGSDDDPRMDTFKDVLGEKND